MTDAPAPLARIDAAIARIEAAAESRAKADDGLRRRHAQLKARMAEAVTALDAVLASAEGQR